MSKDFEFVVADDIIYYTWNDIKSPETKDLYKKVVSLKREISALEEKLDTMRWDYSQNANKRNQLRPLIQDAEEKLNQLADRPKELEKLARNAEIKYLKSKK